MSFPKRICIEGNIGSGKEHISNILKKHFNNNRTIFVPDNINNWRNKDILEKFYKETQKYSFLFEIKSTCDKINSISSINKQIVFLNKSWSSIKYSWVKSLYESKFMNETEYETYNKTYNLLKKPDIDLIIYVRTSPSKCYENIMQRDIKNEKDITLNFVKKLHENYEEWIMQTNIPVYIVNLENLSEDKLINDIFNIVPIFHKIYSKSV